MPVSDLKWRPRNVTESIRFFSPINENRAAYLLALAPQEAFCEGRYIYLFIAVALSPNDVDKGTAGPCRLRDNLPIRGREAAIRCALLPRHQRYDHEDDEPQR